MNASYKQWESEVKVYLEDLNTKLKAHPEASKLYNGFRIWYSPIVENPKLMLLGINPGKGDKSNFGKVRIGESRISELTCHIDNDVNYKIKIVDSLIQSFKTAGFSMKEIEHLFDQQTAYSNFYYMSTKGEAQIQDCLKYLGRNEFNAYKKIQSSFTNELIEIIKPKVVLVLGKGVFNILNSSKFRTPSVWNDECSYYIQNDTTYIGCSRYPGRIRNTNALSVLLKEHITK